MIVATAGHIDHGKSSLVRVLTGVDPDRLPEEKRRGMTIDLGFAYAPLAGGGTIGFVDVPGHERFVRNMLAGVAAVDLALLVVAADDGPMPQTREHLAILDLLGAPAGAVALTKIDRVDAARRAAAKREVRALTAPTALAAAPLFPVSSTTGEGVAALRGHLERAAAATVRGAARGRFRLAVDRCFTLPGAGVVVTGTAFAGSVKSGDRLVLSPLGLPVRVRGIHAQNRAAHAARAGERCALNIAGSGLSKELVHRGDWLLDDALHAPTRRLDVRLRLLAEEEKALRDRAPVHLHLGAVDVTGRVSLLDGRAVEPGGTALARIALDRDIGALTHDRFVLRDASGQRTIGGGRVLDPFPPLRGARRPERLALVAALEADDAPAALEQALAAAPFGIDLAAFARARNLGEAELGALRRRGGLAEAGGAVLALDRWRELRAALLAALAAWHARDPESPGPDPERLRRALAARPPARLFAGLVEDLLRHGEIAREAGHLRLPGHAPTVPAGEAALWERIAPLLAQGGLRPPRVRELAAALAVPHTEIEAVLRRMARAGRVLPVAANRFFPPESAAMLARIAEELATAAPDGRFTAIEFRDRSGIGRNLTIEVLEFLDRQGVTKREGDARRVVRSAADAFPGVG